MVTMTTFGSREEWLKARAGRIGGSEAAAIVGMSKWLTNVGLWELKTGRKTAEDISDNPLVKYGAAAEKYLRELFALDYPNLKVEYVENNMWLNDKYPFAHASLDGWLEDKRSVSKLRRGILEIKTATIMNGSQRKKWDGKLPDNYYCQVLWYMGVVEADFAVVKAQLKSGGSNTIETRHYGIEAEDVREDIDYLLNKGSEFYEYIKSDTCPPLILPNL